MAEVPTVVLTVMSTCPVGCAGATTVIVPFAFVVKEVTWTLPKLTELALSKLVPLIVRRVPPAVGPDEALIPVTTGGGFV